MNPLDGFTLDRPARGSVAASACCDRLALYGAAPSAGWDGALDDDPPERTQSSDHFRLVSTSSSSLDCIIDWPDGVAPGHDGNEGEVVTQARSGLMAVHGRDQHRARRLGLDVATTATGILAGQGVLAALVATHRGHAIGRVETSLLDGGLAFLHHHLTAATCGDPWRPPTFGSAPGPPFATSDGHRVELEMLTADQWKRFWLSLEVTDRDLDRAWLAFAFRHNTASCSLPPALSDATARRSLAELETRARDCDVALRRLRDYGEVLAGNGEHVPASPIQPAGHAWPSVAGAAPRSLRGTVAPIGPLDGIRVVEITSRVQGPLAGLLLRQLGAEVVRVEQPGGDPARAVPPFAGSTGSAFLAYNRGKQPLEVDYRSVAGRAEILDLVSGADVFLHNMRPGRAEELGLGSAELREVNAGLVHAQASGWGVRPPPGSPMATDCLVQAHAGCGVGLNPVGQAAFPTRLTILDVMGGLLAGEAIVAALLLRERTGLGTRVHTSLWGGAMVLQGPLLEALTSGTERGRYLGRPQWGTLDFPLDTADGLLAVAAEPEARRRLAAALGVDGDSVAKRLLNRSAGEWERDLVSQGISCAAVCPDLAALTADPRLAGRLERVEDVCSAPASPWRFSQPG